ncbi:MAG: L-histidine N(alpha)-methyltransferase [Chloroflexi bacterium]|nr:L-histidine N(alpha)-methyltransferase [Chloroflexota bacterium]
MADDVAIGLTASPKFLLPKYFYDDVGSGLFERITTLPEYYLTRTEVSLLQALAPEIIDTCGPEEIVELGSGSSTKARLLFNVLTTKGTPVRYVPFDVNASMLRTAATELLQAYPFLSVRGVVGGFERHIPCLPARHGRRLVLFLGSTIGNLNESERLRLLHQVQSGLAPSDHLLLGVDLQKDLMRLEAAYNDKSGVTAEFNRNILRVINNGLNADFQPEAFDHVAFYNKKCERVEMHLRATFQQTVTVRDVGLQVEVSSGETICTENSYKFTRDSTARMLEQAGLALERWYTDRQEFFGLALATPR